MNEVDEVVSAAKQEGEKIGCKTVKKMEEHDEIPDLEGHEKVK